MKKTCLLNKYGPLLGGHPVNAKAVQLHKQAGFTHLYCVAFLSYILWYTFWLLVTLNVIYFGHCPDTTITPNQKILFFSFLSFKLCVLVEMEVFQTEQCKWCHKLPLGAIHILRNQQGGWGRSNDYIIHNIDLVWFVKNV